ncbi:hypothetical protein FPV67DRAFT_1460864 [Lyophyllum atratum]|nr:hypothetical protein FPV67DRAFT_1460864 [Lyophyllum atratum]
MPGTTIHVRRDWPPVQDPRSTVPLKAGIAAKDAGVQVFHTTRLSGNNPTRLESDDSNDRETGKQATGGGWCRSPAVVTNPEIWWWPHVGGRNIRCAVAEVPLLASLLIHRFEIFKPPHITVLSRITVRAIKRPLAWIGLALAWQQNISRLEITETIMENNKVTCGTKIAHADRVISEFAALVLTSTAEYDPDNDSDEDNNIGLIARRTYLKTHSGCRLTRPQQQIWWARCGRLSGRVLARLSGRVLARLGGRAPGRLSGVRLGVPMEDEMTR